MKTKMILFSLIVTFAFTSYSQTNPNKEMPQQKVNVKTIQIKGSVTAKNIRENDRIIAVYN